MKIINAKLNQDGNFVTITFSDGSIGSSSITDGIRRQYTDVLDEWVLGGGVIAPFETQAEIDARDIAEANQLIYVGLEALDKQSIRDMRAWVASQSTAPQTLKDREALAVAARVKLKQFL